MIVQRLHAHTIGTLALTLALLGCSPEGGGSCTYEEAEGEWVITTITDSAETCCEGQTQVQVAFIPTGEANGTPLWERSICQTPEALDAAGITVDSSWPGGLRQIQEGTCTPAIPLDYPEALEGVPGPCP